MIIERDAIVQGNVRLDTAGPPVNATAIEIGPFAGGRVLCPSSIESTTFTFWECDTAGGDYYEMQSGGADVTATRTASERNSVEIPAACATAKFLKIQSSHDDNEAVTVIKKP